MSASRVIFEDKCATWSSVMEDKGKWNQNDEGDEEEEEELDETVKLDYKSIYLLCAKD